MSRIKQLILFLALACTTAFAHAAVSVDGSQVLQSIRGFGASSAWASSFTTAQLDALFRVDTGIGLSLLRHRIPPDNNFGSGISILQGARDRGAKIWATAWSPPGKWKNNNSPNGPGTGNCNQGNLAYLLPQNYQNFANYLADYVTTLRDTYNVDLFALSPQNEPNWCPDYEASWMTGSDFQTFVRDNLGPTFQSRGINTGIIIPEPINTGALGSLANPCLNDPACRGYLFGVATHLYGTPASAFPAAAANGKEYWETEISSFEAYDGSMTHGLTTADWIHGSMVSGMNAFHYWWAVSDNNNEGLLTNTHGTPKRYYVMGNYSKFVRPGFNRIGATANPANGISVSAYKSATQLVIVAINHNGSASSQTFNLNGLSASSATPWITDPSRNLASQSAVAISGGSFSYSLPAQSVTSFVISLSGTQPSATPTGTNTPVTPVATPTRTSTPVVASTWRVNAGGPAYTDGAGHVWTADANYTGGTARQITDAISGTTDPTLYQSERYGDSSYSFAVPAGSYQVTLRMAETYNGHTAAGQRVFSASINGTTVISDLDLFATAGLFGAVDRVFNNVSPVNGRIVIQLGPASVDNATIGAIEIVPQTALPTSTPTATATATATWTNSPLPTATAVPLSTWRVNAGGPAYTDTAGHAWSADAGYTGGTARQITDAISGTTDPTLYQSERYGDSSYSFAVPSGAYRVTLKMAETYNGITAAGQRVFNVSINGGSVLTNLDLFATAGLFGAVDRVFSNVSPVGGQIVVQLGPASANNATIGAIEIVPMSQIPTATPVDTATSVPPTATPVDTATSVPPTATPVDTATSVPPTSTPVDTATSVPPTATRTSTATATRTWTATPTATATATRTWTATAAPTPAANVQVYHSSSDGVTNNGPHHKLQLRNNGSSAVDLSKVELRYWLNCDCGSEGLQAWVDWSGFTSGGTLSTSVSPLASTAAGQTHVLSFKFAGGSLAPGAIAEIQFRFNRGNWAAMDQSNDYSYAAQPSLTLWDHVAAYLNGAKIWGTEPSGGGIGTASLKDGGDRKPSAPAALALRVGPNPAHGQAIAEMDLPVDGRVRLLAANLAGETVLSLDLGYQSAGRLRVPLDLSRLATGIYLLRLDLVNADSGRSTAWFKVAVQ